MRCAAHVENRRQSQPVLARGFRFAHVTALAYHVGTLRAHSYRLHAGRREYPHVLVGHELTAIFTLGHPYYGPGNTANTGSSM
jgi:hypothetical protein